MIRDSLQRFRQGLSKTRSSFIGRLAAIFSGKVRLDAATLDQIEELLISADMGVQSSLQITRNIEKRLKQEKGEATLESVLAVIRGDVQQILSSASPRMQPPAWSAVSASAAAAGKRGKKQKKSKKGKKSERAAQPALGAWPIAAIEATDADPIQVIFVVGVNGSGKTTSIAKLGALFKARGRDVLLVAADTFRAAAVEQLVVWSERIGVPCVRQAAGADPAAVVFDALDAARARGHDTVIVDTAGRLHTKTDLMAELGKMARVIEKQSGHPPQTLLVVDANTGQNGLAQARIFAETIPVDGLILAKLDGTAKGGIVVAIAETLGLPVRYVGMGEKAEDLAEFDAGIFTEALFADWLADEDAE